MVRIAPTVRYAGPGGDAELLGLYFADAGQHLEHRLFVDHAQPNCRSRVDYKGALQGEAAHTVWIGDVLIRPEATGTDTYERNRNLLLTDGARADSVPNLEILTGEVIGAGHASASGRLEDQQLFYLMARGIPMEEARRLVIRGFFGQLVAKIAVPELATASPPPSRRNSRRAPRRCAHERDDPVRPGLRAGGGARRRRPRAGDRRRAGRRGAHGGELFALSDVCSHAEVPLSEGEVYDRTVECWLHGSWFDLRTGAPTGPPATEPVPVYPVKVSERRRLRRPRQPGPAS